MPHFPVSKAVPKPQSARNCDCRYLAKEVAYFLYALVSDRDKEDGTGYQGTAEEAGAWITVRGRRYDIQILRFPTARETDPLPVKIPDDLLLNDESLRAS